MQSLPKELLGLQGGVGSQPLAGDTVTTPTGRRRGRVVGKGGSTEKGSVIKQIRETLN